MLFPTQVLDNAVDIESSSSSSRSVARMKVSSLASISVLQPLISVSLWTYRSNDKII